VEIGRRALEKISLKPLGRCMFSDVLHGKLSNPVGFRGNHRMPFQPTILYDPSQQRLATPETQTTIVEVKDCRVTTKQSSLIALSNVKVSVSNFIKLMGYCQWDADEDDITTIEQDPVTIKVPQPILQAATVPKLLVSANTASSHSVIQPAPIQVFSMLHLYSSDTYFPTSQWPKHGQNVKVKHHQQLGFLDLMQDSDVEEDTNWEEVIDLTSK
jgi:hypothetical protein